MSRLIKTAARYPWTFLAALLVITLLAAVRIGDLRIRISLQSMMERGTAAWTLFQETEATFGSDSTVIVSITDSLLFTPEKLYAVREALQAIESLPFVSATSSLFSVRNIKNIDGYIVVRPYLDEVPQSAAAAEDVINDAVGNPLLRGNLISADGRTLAINVVFVKEPHDSDFPQRATAAIEEILAALRGRVENAFQIGSPSLQAALHERILHDQSTLMPLSLLVLLMTLGLTLRRLSGALIPLCTAGMSVVWILGLMAWLEIPVNVMTSIVPALIIVIGSTEDIHLLSEYLAGVQRGQQRDDAIGVMADHMGLTVLLTFVTTYLGFLSIAFNNIELLSQFGLIASTGLLFNFLITVILVPVLLRLFGKVRSTRVVRNPGTDPLSRYALALVERVGCHRRSVLMATGCLFLVVFVGATELRVNNNPMDFLAPSSPIHAQADEVHRRLSGIQTFTVVVDGGIDNTFLQIRYLRELRKIQEQIDFMGVFDKSISFADFIALVNQVMGEGELGLPETDDILREYMLFIKHKEVRNYVSPAFDRSKILVRHNIGDSQELSSAIQELQRYIAANVDPALRISITGESILSNKAMDTMSRGQLISLLLLGSAIFVVISILFVNIKAGFVALLPNLFPVLVLFGVMGFTGIPLNTGTGMVAAIALGICIDDTMHAMSRYHTGLKSLRDQHSALRYMVENEAIPIVTSSLALAAGFGVLGFSSFAPVAHFGLLSAMVILLALVATFVITPLLLGYAQLLTVWDLLSFEIRSQRLKQAPLFRGMNTWQIKKLLLASEIRSASAGDVIVAEGDTGSEMFVVLRGTLKVRKVQSDGSVKDLRNLSDGELFGEVAPLTHGKRTADVVALEDTRLLILSWAYIERLSKMFPFIAFKLFRNFTGILSDRLAETSEYRLKP